MKWILITILVAGGILAGFLTRKLISGLRLRRARSRADQIIEEAHENNENISARFEEQKQKVLEYRRKLEEHIDELKDQIESQRARIDSLRERLENRGDIASKIKDECRELAGEIKATRGEYRAQVDTRIRKLEEKSGASTEDVLSSLEEQVLSNARLVNRRMQNHFQETADSVQEDEARRILNRVIQRCDLTTPVSVPSAVLKFPDDDAYHQLKDFYEEHHERLIEDINSDIRFEDDQLMAVVETLKPIDKEIAHRTLNNIIQQKKFNYELVEQGMEKYTRQVRSEQKRAAREVLNEASIRDVPDKLVENLGVLKFRTSYGQQQLVHSQEVAYLGALMAHEIGADADLTRRAGMLHDVGKAVDRQREQGHAVVGAEMAEEVGENEVVVNAIGSHHGDVEAQYVESILVAAADAISGSRPGVRRENVTNYSERIESLRELASKRKGIKKVYAMNAGRELRIRVNKEVIKDRQMEELARSIARDIEEELTYSGQIKINAIRETKITRTARSNSS